MLLWREVSCTSETSCHLTARRGVQPFAGVNVALHVALERSVVESANSGTSETWLEHCIRETDAFAANSEDVSEQWCERA